MTNVYINFNTTNVNFEIFYLHVTGYSNTKESFPSCMFVVLASGKCVPHTYFNFTKHSNLQTYEKLIYFCIIYVAMSNINFSGLDNVKMTCITHKFPSKLLLGKDILNWYSLTLKMKPVVLFGNLRKWTL